MQPNDLFQRDEKFISDGYGGRMPRWTAVATMGAKTRKDDSLIS
jgi:hypothetical protein